MGCNTEKVSRWTGAAKTYIIDRIIEITTTAIIYMYVFTFVATKYTDYHYMVLYSEKIFER